MSLDVPHRQGVRQVRPAAPRAVKHIPPESLWIIGVSMPLWPQQAGLGGSVGGRTSVAVAEALEGRGRSGDDD
ncbi:hypothetical protein [Pseudonocardia ailaonensis]|uniref:hypothetical protein n=1 Tax=Pseudonocardia ailaonensis TaxID=367279 RepID=UPI0031D7EE04